MTEKEFLEKYKDAAFVPFDKLPERFPLRRHSSEKGIFGTKTLSRQLFQAEKLDGHADCRHASHAAVPRFSELRLRGVAQWRIFCAESDRINAQILAC